MSGERAWSSEDTEPFSFKIVFTVFQGIVIRLGIRSKAPKLKVRLGAETYWIRCGKVASRSLCQVQLRNPGLTLGRLFD
jgi:hypothetical protein